MASNASGFQLNLPPLPNVGLDLCTMCFLNTITTNQSLCELCKQKILQLVDDDSTEPKVSVWHCPCCTLINAIDKERCEACGHSKLGSKQQETVLVSNVKSSTPTAVSLTVRDRRHRDQSNAERIFQNIVKYCKENKTNFTDDQFVPAPKSLGRPFGRVTQWLRISEVAPSSHDDHKSRWTMLSSPQPSDIQQGALGNCWLVAVLALISERPRLLEHILLTKELNKEGVYMVRICHNGLWQPIIVDDHFPCTSHKHLVFSQAKRRQLYVPIIEKACAKVFGSYGDLISGNLMEGLQLLTGAPCDHLDLQSRDHPLDEDFTWARLISACEANLLIGTSTGGTDISSEEYTNVHINNNHAYSLLTACMLSIKPHRFVLVRDPHSHSRYAEDAIKGEVLKQLRAFNATDRSTGAFWISWPQFLRYFSSITISTYNSNNFDIREQGRFTRSSTDSVNSYRFHVPQSAMITISLLHHRRNRATHSFHTQAFVLCDADDLRSPDNIGKRESMVVSTRGGFTCWSGALRAGYYVLIPFSTSFWRDHEKPRDFTVVIHSSVHLSLTMQKKSSKFLADCLIAATLKTTSRHERKNEAAFYKSPKKSALRLFIAENSSTTRYLTVDVDMTVAINVHHSRHSHLPYRTHDCIPPQHRQIIYITEWADKRGESAQLNYTYSHGYHAHKSDVQPPISIDRDDIHSPREI